MDERGLQLRQASDIRPNVSIMYTRPGVINVSRNVISFISITKLTVPQINTLVSIIWGLQKEMIYGTECETNFSGEIEIPIAPKSISGSHSFKSVEAALLALMNLKLVYAHNFKGMVAGVVNMISSVEYRKGQFYLAITGKALPWFLFCGHNVGFAKVEPLIFLKISAVREKILYLILMTFVDAKNLSTRLRITAAEIRAKLQYNESVPMSRIIIRVIRPLIGHLKEYGSRFTVQVEYDTVHSGRRGKPAIESVCFIVDGAKKTGEMYETVLEMLSSCWSIWKSAKNTPMNTAIILHRLGDNKSELYAKVIDAVTKRNAKAEKEGKKIDAKATAIWKANLVKKILREDYGIDVYGN